nr:signal peptidase I [uncultured Flavobacterium sp.]
MTLMQWFIFFLIIQVVHFLGTWKLYEKAGRKAWEAAIPVYNSIVLMKIIDRSPWWTLLLFIPIVNLIMFPVIWVETLRAFGKNTTMDTTLGVLTLGLYIYYINYAEDVTYIPNKNAVKKENTLSSLLFAIVVATLVHTYFMQPYVIPSSSLEKSLLIGDYLFVSKFHYGARTPMTTVAAPMVHDSIPFVGIKSYLKCPQLPYFRFPAMQKIEHNDIVVFNWPRDTLFNMYKPADKRYDKPIDKKTNYVKRCVGIPGDSLSIKDGVVFINGKELLLPERAKPQYTYKVAIDTKTPINFEYLIKELNITDGGAQIAVDTIVFNAMTFEGAERLRNTPGIKSVIREIRKGPEDGIFPDFQDGKPSVTNNWSCDNFGPVYIPQEGKTVALDLKSLPYYKIIISEYEKNDLKVMGNDIYINGKKATSYTFKQNYYWMMGDNRHNSLDARYFGYTPEDHIVGKPVFIWMSLDQNIPWSKAIDKIRWERLFTTVGGEGQPVSYFLYFFIALMGYFGYTFFKNRKAKRS